MAVRETPHVGESLAEEKSGYPQGAQQTQRGSVPDFSDFRPESAQGEPELPALSPTVESVFRSLSTEDIDAGAIAGSILTRHSEYGSQMATKLLPMAPTKVTRPTEEWLVELFKLYDFQRLSELSKRPPVVHGRLVIVGLALLDSELRNRLESNGFFSAVASEISEGMTNILSERGLRLLDVVDTVPNQTDEPLRTLQEDRLGRAAFARYLAKRIQAVPNDAGAYAFHIYGPWGSGKSTILNFLKEELVGSGDWIVAEYNAWRYQHIRPPWWSLMERVFRQTKSHLSMPERIAEYWWRLATGRAGFILTAAVLLWLIVLFGVPTTAVAESVSKIIALAVTIWGIALGASRSLLFGAASAAKTYLDLTHDPMNSIKGRFQTLMHRLGPKRVAVFIDDLDRCQGSYVIELLEGIQTLFKDARVVFVVAADRQWLNACYCDAYRDFKEIVHEPGKPLGTLFLEKAFQFSTPVPGIPEQFKEAFWRELVQVQRDGQEQAFEDARQRADEVMRGSPTEGAVLRAINESRGKTFAEQRAIREAAVVRLASPDIVERTEHALLPFAVLLDPNPRSMKRLVNSYSVNRAIATLSHIDLERNDLILWTILSLRWPELAEFLEEYPEMTARVLNRDKDEIPATLSGWCCDDEIVRVLNGEPVNRSLTEDVVRKCAALWV